jgi:hypothetical protein
VTNNKPYAARIQPMLAPNKLLDMDIPLNSISYPKLISKKYNGIRGIITDGHILSRTMADLQICPDVFAYFSEISTYANNNGVVLDGEFHSNTHNTVGETRSILAGKLPMPDDFFYKCFYEIPLTVWNGLNKQTMETMLASKLRLARYQQVSQYPMTSAEELADRIRDYKPMNIEGFMLLNPRAYYKHGRCTLNEETLLKYKYYGDDEDAKIVGLSPRRERLADVEGKQHPTGLAKQVYTQNSFEYTDTAGTMICFIEGDPERMIYVPFPVGFDMEARRMAYQHFGTGNAHDLQNQWITFRRLNCEDRNNPIAIKNVQFRDNK